MDTCPLGKGEKQKAGYDTQSTQEHTFCHHQDESREPKQATGEDKNEGRTRKGHCRAVIWTQDIPAKQSVTVLISENLG